MNNISSLKEKHDKLYWENNNPTISDEAYDYINNLSEDIQISELKLNKDKIIHNEKMLSLDKVYNKTELKKRCSDIARTNEEEFIIQPKYDGIASKILVDHNMIVTRGDGTQGENISQYKDIIKYEYNIYYKFNDFINMLKQKNINTRLGEIVVKKSDFEKNKTIVLRKEGTEYKTPRNMCVGILSKDDINPNSIYVPTFIDYELIQLEFKLSEFDSFDFDSLINQIKESDYPTDGLVIKLKDTKYSKSLGYTSHHPKGQIALKHTNPVSKSTLIDIEWSYGKSVITPVGIVTPIELSGVTVSRTSLHNYKFILDNDIKIGDEIIIERAGDIIPHYVDTLITGMIRYLNVPTICSFCNSAIIYEEPNLKCSNTECVGSLSKIIHSAIVKLGIENIGQETINKMIDVLNISSIIDILKLNKEDIAKLPGFAEKSINNMYDELQRAKTSPIEDWKLLAALNINGIGRTVSKDILLDRTISELLNKYDDLTTINKIGPERASDIKSFIDNKKDFILEFIEVFNEIIEIKTTSNTNQTNCIEICFTGKAPEPREYYKNIAKQLKFIPVDDVKTTTQILVTNDTNSPSSKMKKALKNGVKIITYTDFMELTK